MNTDLQFPTPTADQAAQAAKLRQSARSEWASNITSLEYNAKAEILEHGGMAVFQGLYRRMDGKRVAAKLIDEYGDCWAFCNSRGEFTRRFISNSKMYHEDFEVRDELAPAWTSIKSNGGITDVYVYVYVFRTDGGYPEDAEVV